ncbi:MAG: outer membrane protein assembly factor BamD [Salinibacter sp.]
MRRSLLAFVSLVALVGLAACSSSQKITASGPRDAYEKGVAEYQEGDYDRAIRYFRSVFNYGRGNQWAPEAQFQLAMAQRQKNKHLVAANEFKRFTELYRNHSKVPLAEFEQAKSYYLRSPNYQLSQTDTKKAIDLFQLFVDRHPDHKRVPKAQKMIDELQAKLAHKEFAAAKLYERREMWRAATESYRGVFDQYPETPWADDALLGALRSYLRYADRSVRDRQAERYEKALDQYKQLRQLFPESPLLKQAKPLYAEAQRKLKRVRERERQSQSIAQEGPTQ